jgi:uncharacterized membrane protein YkoI
VRSGRFMYGIGAAGIVAASVTAMSLTFTQEGVPSTVIPRDRALQVALGTVPGTVIHTELDEDERSPVYEIEIRPQTGGSIVEVNVDATTGAVLGTEMDVDNDWFGHLDELFTGHGR